LSLRRRAAARGGGREGEEGSEKKGVERGQKVDQGRRDEGR